MDYSSSAHKTDQVGAGGGGGQVASGEEIAQIVSER